jgi:hypothetical protein
MRLEQLKQKHAYTAQQLMIKAQQSWVKHRDTPKYKEGDQVWLEGKNLRINQPTAKLAPRRHGPFKVIQVMSPVNYRLELPTQWSIHVTDRPVTRRKKVTFDKNAKVQALVQGAQAFKEKMLALEAEAEVREEQQALARAVSTRQYAVVRRTGSVSGRARTT